MTEKEKKRMHQILMEESLKYLTEPKNKEEIVKRAEKRIKEEMKLEAQLSKLS